MVFTVRNLFMNKFKDKKDKVIRYYQKKREGLILCTELSQKFLINQELFLVKNLFYKIETKEVKEVSEVLGIDCGLDKDFSNVEDAKRYIRNLRTDFGMLGLEKLKERSK